MAAQRTRGIVDERLVLGVLDERLARGVLADLDELLEAEGVLQDGVLPQDGTGMLTGGRRGAGVVAGDGSGRW